MVLVKFKEGDLYGVVNLTGREAREFSATDLNGEHFSLDGLKGKVIVLNFWSVSCKPCVKEMPELNKLTKEYTNNENVVFIGFAMDNAKKLNKFFKKKKFDYHIIPNSKEIADRYEVLISPTHVIIDPSAKINYYGIGARPTTKLEESINRCLLSLK